MLKKSLLIIAFLTTAIIFTGCNSDKNAAKTETAPEKVDYIVTKEIPAAAAEGVVDKANPAFVKIYPHFDRGNYPADKGAIKWFTKGLGSKIPAFKQGKLLEVINTDKEFIAYIGNVDTKMFEQYFLDLASLGYQFEQNKTWENFNMFNDKYAINLRFSQEGKDITTLRARILTPEEAAKNKKIIDDKKAKDAKQAQAAKTAPAAKK